MRRDVFQAIADPTRRAIIQMVVEKEMNLNAVSEQFNISRPAISKHIRILTECGLITIRQQGRERICIAQPENLKDVYEWAAYYRSFWSSKLDALEAYLNTTQTPAAKNVVSTKKHKK